jgi:hypothetical protein
MPNLARKIIVLVALARVFAAGAALAESERFQSDSWITECESEPSMTSGISCTTTAILSATRRGLNGSFGLAIGFQTGMVAIVGQPFPTSADIQIDKNPPIHCQGTEYCVFPDDKTLEILQQLGIGKLILLNIITEKGVFRFNLTPKGYRAGAAKMQAWSYPLHRK